MRRLPYMAFIVVNNTTKYDKVSRAMRSLHWLKVRECIIYKTAC